jgi:hypothetical protein
MVLNIPVRARCLCLLENPSIWLASRMHTHGLPFCKEHWRTTKSFRGVCILAKKGAAFVLAYVLGPICVVYGFASFSVLSLYCAPVFCSVPGLSKISPFFSLLLL